MVEARKVFIHIEDKDIEALDAMLKYAQGEHGKSQQGYYSESGWCGDRLKKLLDHMKAAASPAKIPHKVETCPCADCACERRRQHEARMRETWHL